MINKIIKYFLDNKLITVILLLVFIAIGMVTSPFNWNISILDEMRNPVSVDAIPDIGENQQIVFTKWAGKSPQDIEDQITYPLTSSLLGLPGIKTVRSSSMFGFSSIMVIFEEDIEFYWSRSRILEKLNSLPSGVLPTGVTPTLGPDATGLGQIFWYTLEGRDKDNNVVGGWGLEELRSIQDFYIKYGLSAAKGVSEVSSIGGFVKEYQIDIDPALMKTYGVNIKTIMNAIKNSNLDIGARTIEINNAEYFIRGIGYIKNISDLENSVVKVNDNVPIYIKDVAKVFYGPAERRGILDKNGAEVVGGVVVARYGENPLEVIENVKQKIEEIEPGLPSKTLIDGTISKVKIVPFYDRTILIKETLGTLNEALTLEMIITIIVIIIMVMNLRASILISFLIPIAVLMTFGLMKYYEIDANIVALSGIAIAIGTIVDIGIVISENILRHIQLEETAKGISGKFKTSYKSVRDIILKATNEVAGSVITAILTTIVSFIPVFLMEASEGKLFRPLAFTKTFVLSSSLIVALIILPAIAHILFSIDFKKVKIKIYTNSLLLISGIVWFFISESNWAGFLFIFLALVNFTEIYFVKKDTKYSKIFSFINLYSIVLAVIFLLTEEWLPLGASNSTMSNFLFTTVLIGIILGFFTLFKLAYKRILTWALENKLLFFMIPVSLIIWSLFIWFGFSNVFGFVDKGLNLISIDLKNSKVWKSLDENFKGIGKEFMPSLDEGSFLLMPTSMPHSGIEENKRVLKLLDILSNSIPEVEYSVGKLGRVESPLDPAPISMYENIISYKTEYKTDENGNKIKFKFDDNKNEFVLNKSGKKIRDRSGRYFRQWREKIKNIDDIWDEVVRVTKIPGVTSAPKLMPIETRLIMLQTGMRAPIGMKIYGNDLKDIEKFGLDLEKKLKNVKGINEASIFAERMVGKPYIELNLNRENLGRYGLSVKEVQQFIAVAIGGVILENSVEGRERYPIRLRYAREFRDSPEMLGEILIPTKVSGVIIPLSEVVDISYTQGPQVIKSEDSFLLGYLIFDGLAGFSEVEVVENADKYLKDEIKNGNIEVPNGVSYTFTGNYENQLRAEKKLAIVIPIVLVVILLILYFQFKKIMPSLIVFTGIFVAFSGGFIMIWFYGQDWFLNFSILDINLRDIFQVKEIYLSVAVWVGFIALFGIATDDGVLITTYLEQIFEKRKPKTTKEINLAVIEAGSKRIRPCLMTTATTILALLPILTSSGRGSDIMIPMAIPVFGGMVIELITLFVIPVTYATWKERGVIITN